MLEQVEYNRDSLLSLKRADQMNRLAVNTNDSYLLSSVQPFPYNLNAYNRIISRKAYNFGDHNPILEEDSELTGFCSKSSRGFTSIANVKSAEMSNEPTS